MVVWFLKTFFIAFLFNTVIDADSSLLASK